MNKLDKLKERDPLIFPKPEESQPFNDWGFECGEGWYDILDAAFNTIYSSYAMAKRSYEYSIKKDTDESITSKYKTALEKAKDDLPVIEQCKSKFGTLRLYCRNTNDRSSAAIDMAEHLSGLVCERCGNKSTVTTQGWRTNLCQPCVDVRDEKIASKQSAL